MDDFCLMDQSTHGGGGRYCEFTLFQIYLGRKSKNLSVKNRIRP